MLGDQLVEQSSESYRLVTQLRPHETFPGARGVAFVEHQIDHGEHGPKPTWELVRVRNAIRNSRVANLALGADETLSHRRLGHEKSARDLRGGKSGEKPQRECHLDIRR